VGNDFRLGDWVIRPQQGCIELGDNVIRIKPKAMAVLERLARAGGKVVTRNDLFDSVWPNTEVSDATLSQCVVELRHAFGESAKDAKILRTVPKIGFLLVPPVTPLQRELPGEVEDAGQAEQGTAKTRRFKAVGLFLVAGMVVAVIALAWYQAGRPDKAQSTGLGEVKSIVVLPLADMSPEPAQAYFVEGMQEALITRLAQIEALSVISRTTATRYRGTTKSVPEIAEELGVEMVVEGSVLRVGDTVRITVQLIDGKTDRHVWAESFDRELIDILSLHSEVTREIVSQIRVVLTPQDRVRLTAYRPVNPEAYELYLEAWFLLQDWSAPKMIRAVELMRKAVRLDPESAAANAGLALSLQFTSWFNFIPPLDIVNEAKAAATRAVELDGQLADAHVARGAVFYYLEFNYPAAKHELEQALKLNPGSDKVLIELSWVLGESGQFERAIELAKQLVEIAPFSSVSHNTLGQVHYLAGDFEQAKQHYGQALELGRGDPSAYYFLAWPHEELGEYEQAIELHRTAVKLSGTAPVYLSGLGYALAKAGQHDEARAVLGELNSRLEAGDAVPIEVALIHLGLGELDQAMDLIEQAFNERSSRVTYIKEDSKFDPLRERQDFQALIEKIWSAR